MNLTCKAGYNSSAKHLLKSTTYPCVYMVIDVVRRESICVANRTIQKREPFLKRIYILLGNCTSSFFENATLAVPPAVFETVSLVILKNNSNNCLTIFSFHIVLPYATQLNTTSVPPGFWTQRFSLKGVWRHNGGWHYITFHVLVPILFCKYILFMLYSKLILDFILLTWVDFILDFVLDFIAYILPFMFYSVLRIFHVLFCNIF